MNRFDRLSTAQNGADRTVLAKENPIEKLAASLQRLPAGVRWLYARQDLVSAAALGCEPERGPWSRRADRMMGLAWCMGIAPVLAATVNLALLMLTYARQCLVRPMPKDGALFVGFGAAREPELIRQFKVMQDDPIVYLDERSLDGFFRQSHVGLLVLLHEMLRVWRGVWGHLRSSGPSVGVNKVYVLSFFMMHGHLMAYMRAWFRQYASRRGDAAGAACTTTSLLAHAPIAIGLDVTHMEHGFQRHCLIYPDFARSICFNGPDAAHIRRRLPRCTVTLAAEPIRCLRTRRIVAIAGVYWPPDRFDLIDPFITWVLRNELPIVVRKHQSDTSSFWDRWRDAPGFKIIASDNSFAEFLETELPRMLATWYLTTLFDCLARGILPITVTPENHEAAPDVVFPFRELSLCWPEHEQIAQRFLDDDEGRVAFVTELYARATSIVATP